MSLSVLPGELVVTRLTTVIPTWWIQNKNPDAHCLKLLWKLRVMRQEEGDVNCSNSNTFPLGKEWLTAHLELKIKEAQLSLEVAPEHVARVVSRIRVSTDKAPGNVADYMISKINVNNGNRWILPLPDCNVFTQNLHNAHSYNYRNDVVVCIEVNIEVVVISTDEELESAFRESKIAKDIASLLEDKGSTNATLKVGDTELGAHKCMLGARSPVLKAMLSTDMVEGRTGVIKLQHMSVEAAEAFLGFIYTARIDKEKLLETAEDLLPASVMYEMPDLHAVSEVALRQTIAVENVARLLLLASLYDAPDLKKDVLAFVKRNKIAVTASNDWKDVIGANPKLILEAIMDAV